MLNRAALIVRPAAPYLEWAAGLDGSGLPPDPEGERTVYLLPKVGDDEEAEEVLRLVYAAVFENELAGWYTLEDDWPKNRTFEMFKQWFKIEVHSVVEDLSADPLLDDDDEYE
jgi:hypothetical protein